MKYRLQKLSALALCLIMLISILLPASAVKKPKSILHTFTVQSYLSPGTKIIAGDINGDDTVNNKDLIRFLKYLSGWLVTVNSNPDILDVNGDTAVNNKDLLRLLKYLSKWSVTIYPICPHTGATYTKDYATATCSVPGYTGDTYCSVCDKKIADGTPIPTIAHTPGTPVNENTVPATCTAAGSYEEVTYCTVCSAEISRIPQVIAKTAHNYISTAAPEYIKTAADCTHAAVYYKHCSACEALSEETFTSGDPNPLAHSEEYFAGGVCTICGKMQSAPMLAYNSLNDNQKGIYNILDENINILNKEHILLNDYYNAETFGSDVKVALEAVKNDRPEYFWIPRSSFSYGAVTIGSKLLEAYVSFDDPSNPEKGLYAVTASEKETMQAALEAKVTEIVNAAKDLSTDFQKELYVHDYICQHASYDHDAEKAGISGAGPIPWTVYGALINGNCVCEGYSRAMQLICNRLGINCGLATGKGFTSKDELGNDIWEDHMWNIIELDGEIYYLDVTWDDGLESTLLKYGLQTKNIHAYFNVTKSKIQLDHIFDQKFNKEALYGQGDSFTFFDYDGDATLYNYYLYTGAYIGNEDDIVSASQFIIDSYLKGNTEFVIKFDTSVNIENAYINMYSYLYNELQNIGCDFIGIGTVEDMFFCKLVPSTD